MRIILLQALLRLAEQVRTSSKRSTTRTISSKQSSKEAGSASANSWAEMERIFSAGTSTRSAPSCSTAAQSFRRAALVSISRGEKYSASISAFPAKAGAWSPR